MKTICLYCDHNHPFDKVTGNKYKPLGRNKFNYYLKILRKDLIQKANIIVKMTKEGIVYL